MTQYVVQLPKEWLLYLTTEAETLEQARDIVHNQIKEHHLKVVSVDDEDNYLEIGELTYRAAPTKTEQATTTRRQVTRRYELEPDDYHKSFYKKAIVEVDNLGNYILYSYGTPVAMKDAAGGVHRLWDDWSATTGRHIATFCGLNKKQFNKLELERL